MPNDVITGPYHFDKVPDKCPACGHFVELKTKLPPSHANNEYVIVFCICPRDDCKAPVLLNYKKNAQGIFEFKSIFMPDGSKIKCIYGNEEIISDISENFVKIYNQAQQAEFFGLDLICGAGYRRAFEYLIKDYASKDRPDDAEKIQNMSVSSVIKKYVNDPDLEKIAKRAVWLGNDEAHVVRKWEEKDLKDLKELIDITVASINRGEKIKKYTQDMPNKE